MATCFLFLEPTDMAPIEQLWAVRLDDAGEVDVPLASYTLEEIKSMQMGSQTIVVLPTSSASLHRLELPKLSARKAREAIPYALEEELAEPVAEVHVAFDRETDASGRYCIVVINRLRLRAWMNELEALGVAFDAITLDWFAVHVGEVCATSTDLLVHQEAAVGALSPLLATQYLKAHPDAISGFAFDDSEASLQQLNLAAHEGSYRLFVAKRLLEGEYINLCQGSFQHRAQGEAGFKWYGVCAVLLGVWFVSVLGINAFALHRLHVKQAALDVQIAKGYHVFFPEATQVISPRFRIERFLSQTSGTSQDAFWTLLDAFAEGVALHALDIEQIRFRDNILWVNVIARDFALLEAFEARLKKVGVHVKQTQASTRDNQVSATLELRL